MPNLQSVGGGKIVTVTKTQSEEWTGTGGAGTIVHTFDFSAVPNFGNLTADDFIIGMTVTHAYNYQQGNWAGGWFAGKTYNPANGNLTVSVYHESGWSCDLFAAVSYVK